MLGAAECMHRASLLPLDTLAEILEAGRFNESLDAALSCASRLARSGVLGGLEARIVALGGLPGEAYESWRNATIAAGFYRGLVEAYRRAANPT